MSVTLVSTSTTQGATAGSGPVVWSVGDVAPSGAPATLAVTVTLHSDTVDQSVINSATAGAGNALLQSVEVCPDNSTPAAGVCAAKPQAPPAAPEPDDFDVFLPIVIANN